jgi:hypothetical protein
MVIQGDTYYVHYFNPENFEERVLNGKPLPPEWFRDYDRPDQVLVAWHYAQTVMMRTRGQSVGMIHR